MADQVVTTAPAPEAPVAAPSVDVKSSQFTALETKARTMPEKKVEPAKDAEAAPDKNKEPDPIKPDPKKEDRTAKDPKWFREQHEKAQVEIKTYAGRVKELETKIAEAESRGKDTTVLTERLSALEKERDDLRGELRAARQEVSPEFKEKWDKPFNQGASYAKDIVEQMSVATEEGASRPATWEDFTGLYSMPINKAAAAARQMFGEDAGLIIGQLTELHRLDYQRKAALAEEKAKWKENETKDQSQRVQAEHGFKAMVAEVQKQLAETNPDFKDAPGEEGQESRQLREQGYSLFDKRPETIQEAAIKTAHVRHAYAAYYPLVRERDTLRSKLKEAEVTIAELRGNGPNKGRRTTTAGAGTDEESWSDGLRKDVTAV